MKRLLLTILFLLLISTVCFAETRDIITEGTYNMGDGETPQIAEERALVQAKRQAIEQAGIYLESYSETSTFKLTKDEVRVISSGVINTIVLDKSRTMQDKGGFQFWVKIKVTVTTDNIANMVNRIRELSTSDRYEEVQQKYDLLQTKATEPSNNEKQWLVNYWLDIGIQQYLVKDYKKAIDSFTKSYNLNRNNTATILLGDAYYELKDYDNSLHWYNEATDTDVSFLKRGLVYEKLTKEVNKLFYFGAYMDSEKCLRKARSAYENAVRENSNNEKAWFRLGLVEERFQDNEDYSIHCYTKSISLNPYSEMSYYHRGIIYEKVNKPYEAAQDYKRFLQLTTSTDVRYSEIEKKMKKLKDHYGIM